MHCWVRDLSRIASNTRAVLLPKAAGKGAQASPALAPIGRHMTGRKSQIHQRLSQARRSAFQVLVVVSLIVAAFRGGKRMAEGAYSPDGTGTLHREVHPTLAYRAD
jgi:hypothetical protein